jgi:DNA-binding MltR family transcriptional regulator
MKEEIKILDKQVNKLNNESDRACIILAGSIIDDVLYKIFDRYLVSFPSSNDPLFNNNGALSTLSNKIDLAYRFGIISNQMCKSLHSIRKLRNICAHEYESITFNDQKVKDISNNLFNITKLTSAVVSQNVEKINTRAKFTFAFSYLIHELNIIHKSVKPLESKEIEFGLTETAAEEYIESKTSSNLKMENKKK